MNARSGEGFTVATDVADAMIAGGSTAREAHAAVGAAILASERNGVAPDWPNPRASVEGKATSGSTHPTAVREALDALRSQIAQLLV
jgi:argininosuccinate lyase